MLHARRNLGNLCLAPLHFTHVPAYPTCSRASPAPLRPGSTHKVVGSVERGKSSVRDPCHRERWLQEMKEEPCPESGVSASRLGSACGGCPHTCSRSGVAADEADGGHLLGPHTPPWAQRAVSQRQHFICPPPVHHSPKTPPD